MNTNKMLTLIAGTAMLALSGCTGVDDLTSEAELKYDGNESGSHSDKADCDAEGRISGAGDVNDGSVLVTVTDGDGTTLFSERYDGGIDLSSRDLNGDSGTWTLRAGGAVLAESTTAIELTEKNAPPQIYFPCRDVAMALLEPSNHTSHCDHKGTAHYFSIITKSTKLANVASGYANPTEALAAIKDHVTFQTSDQVTVERI